jgi:hypothetical protein
MNRLPQVPMQTHTHTHTHTYTCTCVCTYIHARACIAELTRKLLVHYKMLWAGCSAESRETVSLDIQQLVAHRLEVPQTCSPDLEPNQPTSGPLSPTCCHFCLHCDPVGAHVNVCMRACVRVCVRMCMCLGGGIGGG